MLAVGEPFRLMVWPVKTDVMEVPAVSVSVTVTLRVPAVA